MPRSLPLTVAEFTLRDHKFCLLFCPTYQTLVLTIEFHAETQLSLSEPFNVPCIFVALAARPNRVFLLKPANRTRTTPG